MTSKKINFMLFQKVNNSIGSLRGERYMAWIWDYISDMGTAARNTAGYREMSEWSQKIIPCVDTYFGICVVGFL